MEKLPTSPEITKSRTSRPTLTQVSWLEASDAIFSAELFDGTNKSKELSAIAAASAEVPVSG
jgi:hypothetical protein